MGLDITAYAPVVEIEVKYYNRDGEPLKPDGTEYDYNNYPVEAYLPDPSFASSFEGLEEGHWYATGDESEHWHRSYGGYNRVREDFCQAFLGVPAATVWEYPEKFKDEPLYDMINFSDCEGCIGPVAAKRIHDALVAGRTNGSMEMFVKMQDQETYDAFERLFDIGSRGMVCYR